MDYLILFCVACLVGHIKTEMGAAPPTIPPPKKRSFRELIVEFNELEKPRGIALERAERIYTLMENKNVERAVEALKHAHKCFSDFKKFFQEMYNAIHILHSTATQKQKQKALNHVKDWRSGKLREPWCLPKDMRFILEEIGPEFIKKLVPLFDPFINTMTVMKDLYPLCKKEIENVEKEFKTRETENVEKEKTKEIENAEKEKTKEIENAEKEKTN
ncbi:uncharacterized protein [Bemisia tabaci]|uniref:uncharacterized protein n=1 Tax=Bemisia tabaci TaxID=7038 RepID=UPI003B28ABF7